MTQRAQIKTCPAGICLHLCNLRFIIAMGSAEWMPSKSQSAILMTLSINLRPRSPLDLLPCPAGRGVFENALLAAPQFVALPIGKRQLGVFLGDAIPKIFHKLNAFSTSKFEERCEFGVHDQKLSGSMYAPSTIRNMCVDSMLEKTLIHPEPPAPELNHNAPRDSDLSTAECTARQRRSKRRGALMA